MSITAPRNMSSVNAFYALWKIAKTLEFYRAKPHLRQKAEEALSTSEKVAAFIKENPIVDTAGGRIIGVDFRDFPHLNVKRFNEKYGEEAAQRALWSYHQIPPKERFDPYDIHFKPAAKL